MKIRALIVDDEPLARKRIRLLAQDEADLECMGECSNGVDAIAAIGRNPPDLVFLDVQMPEMDGFAVLEQIPRDRLPAIVFTTAYDKHAIRAFEVHALDYLLKPIEPNRFKAAVAHVREHMRTQQTSSAARGLLELLASRKDSTPTTRYLTRLPIKTDEKVAVIKTADIDTIESAGNYVSINAGKESYILRETLNALETQLDPEIFLR